MNPLNTDKTDEQLMQNLLQTRNRQAYLELVQRWKQPLMAYFYRHLAQRENAEELVQEVFLKVWTCRHYQSRGQFRAWIYRLAHNVRIDFLRQQKITTTTLETQHLETFLGTAQGPEEVLLAREEKASLQHALKELPEPQRDLIILSRFQDLSHGEIAAITGRSRNTVKVQIFRALKQLGKKFREVTHV